MKGKNTNSLSTRIVFLIALVSLIITFGVLSVFEKINREAFYQMEMEKADIIAKTIEPLVALNIYLDMQENVNQIVLQLLENPNILSVKIATPEKIINKKLSEHYKENQDGSFVVESTIFQPDTKQKIGTITLIYSNKKYKELVGKHASMTLYLLFGLVIVFLFFSLYIRKLLSPLRTISKMLKNYTPEQHIEIPFASQNNEIGLISNILNEMQHKISEYAKKQKDISHYLEEKVTEKTSQLRHQLYANSLTNLPNRLSLLKDITFFDNTALLIINIDDFKEINDFFGHFVGDAVLMKFSTRLIIMVEQDKNIVVHHLFGDEFALLFLQKPPLQDFIRIAQKLNGDIEKMILFHENNEIGIRATIGGAYQTDGGLEKADIALKSAKKQRKSFLLYDEKLHIEKQYKENMEWVKKLRKAVEQDMIVPFFQPIVDNYTDKIVSYECLIRLIDDNKNIVNPYLFLNIAKKSRLYSTLTKIMIEKSCRHFEHLEYDFSVNLSVEDILDNDIVDYIKNKIAMYGVADKIVFEILESEGIENYEEISIFTKEMKKLGCRIAIDDFGSGYSNFEHLLKLNIDYIKIDGTLIKNLDKDINAQIIVEVIVDFAKKLNIFTIAEFVHSKEVFEKVKELNVNRSQGFFIAEPQKSI
ncbi:MAG: EAL domain-containing protein [Sulfurimonas sp.]|nr:EAL domain-containing protein [Sulfurimonas sp.]